MREYARIQDGMVYEIYKTDGDIATMFHPSLIWVDITDIAPQPDYGWLATKSGDTWTFTSPSAPNWPPV
jgi:hypothetical protein